MKFTKSFSLILIILIAFLLLSYKINKPFIGHHDWNGVFFGNVANNTAKYGFWKTKFGAVYTFLPKSEADFKFYTHYPPVFHLLLGLEAKLIGVHEWSMRLLSILFSLFSLYFFYKLSEKLCNQKIAIIASLFYILNPMFLYFAKMPIHEVFGLAFIAMAFYHYLIFFQKENRINTFKLILTLILACQTVWSAYYLIPIFIIHYLIFKKRNFRKISLLLLIPIISFASHLIHSWILTGNFDNNLFSTMLFRMQLGSRAAKYSFTILQYIKQEALWLTVYFTRIITILAFGYSLILLKKIARKTANYKDRILASMLIFPFIDPIIFRNVSYIHDYKLYYFLLILPLLAAICLYWLNKKVNFIWKKNKIITLALLLIIFGLFTTERLKYTKTLLDTSMNKPAYDLGLIIKDKTRPEENVLVGSYSFAEFLDLFLNFYGQRNIIYFNPEMFSFKNSLTDKTGLVVLINSREQASPDLINYLKNNYQYSSINDFILFDLK